MFTRGRLVPRQPRAIKSTTRTELRNENIRSDRCVHWNIGTTPTALHHEGIHIAKFIHWNTGTIPTALRRYNIHYGGYIHWNVSPFCYLFIRMLALNVLQNECFNTIGVAVLIAQGCQTIVQATLG